MGFFQNNYDDILIVNNNDNHLGTILIAPHFFIEDFNLRSIEKIEVEYQSGNFRKRLSKYCE
mgnify:CR=1 FL=1